ncbi:rod shape-determining protein MreC [bacterium]|nr:rod shape-determining protein MreC [candidate division CSSED10-310 bacterium]
MRFFATQYRPWVIYAACSLAALSIFTSNLRGGEAARVIESIILSFMTPLYTSVDWVADYAVAVWTEYFYLVDLRRENTFLNNKLVELEIENIQLQEKLDEIRRLRMIFDMPEGTVHRRLPAGVVRRAQQTWNTVLIVNVGSLDGIRPYMGIASSNGVVGQVVRVAPRASKSITVLHPKAGISVILQKSRISGIVSGSGSGSCILKFISRFDRVVLGESVLTSGLDGAFPKGLPVGQVCRIERNPGEIFQKIEIMPFVDLATLENVVLYLPEAEVIPVD